MRIEFEANQVGIESDEYCLVCGLSGCDGTGNTHHLMFSRDSEGNFEDWGPHLEFDDQCNSSYNCISKCELSRMTLHVDLSQHLGDLDPAILGFDIRLKMDDSEFTRLMAALRLIFRDTLHLLMENRD